MVRDAAAGAAPPAGAGRGCRRGGGRGARRRRGLTRGENRPHAHHGRPRPRLRLAHVDDDVMDVRAIAGAHLPGLHPAVFGEVGGHLEVLVVDRAARRHLEVGQPSRTPGPACRSASPRRTSATPAGPSGCPRARRRPPTGRWCRSPPGSGSGCCGTCRRLRSACHGGITASRHLFADRAGPWPHVLEREQRHRRHFAGPVAARALREHDRRDIAAERQRPIGWPCRSAARRLPREWCLPRPGSPRRPRRESCRARCASWLLRAGDHSTWKILRRSVNPPGSGAAFRHRQPVDLTPFCPRAPAPLRRGPTPLGCRRRA